MIELEVLGNDPIELEVTMPSGGGFIPSGTKQVTITENGTYTEDVYDFANAEIDVNVPIVTPTGTKNISIVTNGTTTEDVENYADAEITVNVPNTYTESDEGKVVNNGELISQTSATYTENDTYDTTLIDEVTIDVATINNQDKTVTPTTSQQNVTADAGYTGLGTVTVEAMPNGTEGTPTATKGAVSNHAVDVTPSVTNTEGYIAGGTKNGTAVKVSASELVSGTKIITANGTEDVTNYASVNVSVPNSYDASDEGKVVDNGSLVAQGSATYTENGTYDTTLVDDVTVNVASGGGISVDDIAMKTVPTGHVILSVPFVKGYDQDGIRGYAFTENRKITSIELTTYPNIYGYAFYNIPNLVSFSATLCESLGNIGINHSSNVFQNCKSLKNVSLPLLENLGGYVFSGCSALEILDFPSLIKINGNYTFQNCTNLDILILRNANSAVTLNNVNDFAGSPFASGKTGGTLYVPQALISSYQSATNWSTILGYANNQILPIEGSIYETQYADGTPIE